MDVEVKIQPKFEKWLHGLKDIKAVVKIVDRIDRMTMGNLGSYKTVGKGVCETKVEYGPGYRIYFGRKGNALVIILAGSEKKDQNKTVKEAQNLWKQIK